jgi:hypothetical protein
MEGKQTGKTKAHLAEWTSIFGNLAVCPEGGKTMALPPRLAAGLPYRDVTIKYSVGRIIPRLFVLKRIDNLSVA